MIRASGLCTRSGRSLAIIVNGPMTVVANVRSKPSAVISRVSTMVPALSTSTSSRGSRWRISAAAALTDDSDAMSATTVEIDAPGVSTRSSDLVRSSRPPSLPTSTRRAPMRAKEPAAARPSPDVGPVMTTVRPAIDSDSAGSQENRRERSANPNRVKLGTTSSSARPSGMARKSITPPCSHETPVRIAVWCERTGRRVPEPDPWRSARDAPTARDHRNAPAHRRRVRLRCRLRELFAAGTPTAVTSDRIDAGPVGVGARYRLGVRHARRASCRWSTASSPGSPAGVSCSRGSGPACAAIDEIRFDRNPGRDPHRLHRRHPPHRLDAPRRAARRRRVPRRSARTRAAGMQQALEERADARAPR